MVDNFVISKDDKEVLMTNSPSDFVIGLLQKSDSENLACAILSQMGYTVTIMKFKN